MSYANKREVYFRVWQKTICNERREKEVVNKYLTFDNNKTKSGVEFEYRIYPLTGAVSCSIDYDEIWSKCEGEPTGAVWNAGDDVVVEQFTGLKDKNEREIFEGDIICFCNSIYLEVIWDEDEARFDIENRDFRRGCYVFNKHSASEMEIVGNIHENPELLEAKL